MSEENNPVNWFEIPVNDLERASKFYENVFGIELDLNQMGSLKTAWFPMFPGAPGAAGTLAQGEGYSPSHTGTLVYFSVDDINATLDLINEHGGKTLTPKSSIGDYGFIARFEDCEGNRVALHARD